uniref:Ribosomal protein S3 n=1 Tax=Reclinomonas americana ATCC 50284 TaxID=1295595 RepID=M4QE67_RECAM|nr:ribosomal protein S3 [Reclinomonas americana ATCC 50284]
MGQKVNPISLRIGVNQLWDSRWSHDKKYTKYLEQDLSIRSFIEDLCNYQEILIGKLSIWRSCSMDSLTINIKEVKNVKPNLFIYFQMYVPYKTYSNNKEQKQEWLMNLENTIYSYLEDRFRNSFTLSLLIDPIFEEGSMDYKRTKQKNEIDSVFNNDLVKWLLNKDCLMISQWIANEFQKRKGLKEVCKTIEKCFDSIKTEGIDLKYRLDGIKITCSGRFKMTDNEKRRNKMARIKTFKKGQIPLQTLSKYINYHMATAYTPDGTSGIKIWISYEPREILDVGLTGE